MKLRFSPSAKVSVLLSLLLDGAAILLMAFPIGAVLEFADGPDSQFTLSFSYFDISVLGMSGNIFPLLTAILSVVLFLLLLVVWFTGCKKNGWKTVASVISVLSSIFSISGLIFFFTFSPIGILIAILLFLCSFLLCYFYPEA